MASGNDGAHFGMSLSTSRFRDGAVPEPLPLPVAVAAAAAARLLYSSPLTMTIVSALRLIILT